MRATGRNETELIAAARAGDRRALDDLVTAYLPLVYTIVGRALDVPHEVDDVVQEVMLRAVRHLPALRDAESFRPWLTSIAVRHVGTHLARTARAERRTAALTEADAIPDADFEGAALLRADLSGQRHQTRRAGRWLDPDDRVLLSLWWLEVADELTRTELAAALGVSVAHAGVRVQRMRGQLEASRSVVAAWEARPRCPGLTGAMAGWDGVPSPLWRKRAVRHVRGCARCGRAADGLLPADRLLPTLALVPVPAGLAAALLGKLALGKAGTVAAAASALSSAGGAATGGAAGGAGTAAGAGAAAGGGGATGTGTGLLGTIAQAIAAHPVVATVTAGALAAGAATGTARVVTSPEPARPPLVGTVVGGRATSPASPRA
ncbi:RNA polymerase sigma factor, partial [Micromonospora sp. I033]